MENRELYVEIHILLGIMVKNSIRALDRRLRSANAGVGGLQFGIMRALSAKEHTISELSDHLMLDPSTLVPAVDALERKGFAKRGKDPSDRRRIPVALTDKGTELIRTMHILDEQDPLVQSLNTLDGEQRQQFLVLLRELVQSLPDGEDLLEKASARVHLRAEREPALP